MQIDFTGQVVLVTGASRGIGERIAADFARLGADLIVTSTRPEAQGAIEARFGPRARHRAVDFTDRRALEAFLKEIESLDRLDACVNNAGISRHGPIEEATADDWDATHEVDLRAPYFITQAAGRAMKKRRYGRIVNISSIWGHITLPQRSIYTAAKFGLRGLTLSAAADLAPFCILVNAVSPGFTMTDMLKQNYSETQRQAMASRVPLGRLADPGEVSAAVLFLAAPVNTYITGQNLVVDGGYSIV